MKTATNSKRYATHIRERLKQALSSFGFKSQGNRIERKVSDGDYQMFEVVSMPSTTRDCLVFRVQVYSYHVAHEEAVRGTVEKVPNYVYPSFAFDLSHVRGDVFTKPYRCASDVESDRLAEEVVELAVKDALPLLDEIIDYKALLKVREEHPVFKRRIVDPEVAERIRASVTQSLLAGGFKIEE